MTNSTVISPGRDGDPTKAGYGIAVGNGRSDR
jgi:hypothetical protein